MRVDGAVGFARPRMGGIGSHGPLDAPRLAWFDAGMTNTTDGGSTLTVFLLGVLVGSLLAMAAVTFGGGWVPADDPAPPALPEPATCIEPPFPYSTQRAPMRGVVR